MDAHTLHSSTSCFSSTFSTEKCANSRKKTFDAALRGKTSIVKRHTPGYCCEISTEYQNRGPSHAHITLPPNCATHTATSLSLCNMSAASRLDGRDESCALAQHQGGRSASRILRSSIRSAVLPECGRENGGRSTHHRVIGVSICAT